MTYTFVQGTGQCLSLSEVDRQIAHWFWYFSAFNSFVGGIVGSTLASQFLNIIHEGPGEVIFIIGNFVPSSSSFFLNYIMFRTLVSIPMRLLIPHPQLRFYIFRRWIFRSSSIPLTPRDKAFLYAPTSPRYGFEIGLQCGIFLIALAFSVISPIITVACCVYFAFAWVFWRYSVLYVYVRKYESGGLMWPFVFQRILVMLVVMAVFTSCVFVVKGAFIQATLLLILVPTWVSRFSHYSWHRFQKGIDAMPLQSAQEQVPARVDPRVYIPPPLIAKATGWYPEWTKVWAGWGLPP